MDNGNSNSVNYDLLGKYFAGECTDAERLEAEAWIAASEENRVTFAALRAVWEQARPAGQPVDTDAAWQRVQARIQAADAAQEPAGAAVGGRWYWAAAAALLVGMALGLYFYSQQDAPAPAQLAERMIEVVPQQDGETLSLPDGSTLRLKAGSRVRYAENFAVDRRVELQGEAFFDVQRDSLHPFVIQAGDAAVTVLGTSFVVREDSLGVAVAVRSGRVALEARQEELILLPGDKGVYAAGSGHLVRDQVEAQDLYWVDQELQFRGTPLGEVAAQLEAVFDISILFDEPAMERCPFTGKFEDESIESVLGVVAQSFNMEMTQDENTFTLSGGECP